MTDTVTLLEKIIKKFQRKPDTFNFLVESDKNIEHMVSEIYNKYMNLPKFSDLVKTDKRKSWM